MNYGLDIEKELSEHTEEDWIFGSTSLPCIALIPEGKREKYLPDGEIQRGKEDFQDCATRGPINKVETKFTYLYQNGLLRPENASWLEENEYVKEDRVLFSDRFIAILSGTTPRGNSLKAPIHAMHKYGLIPKSMLPAGNLTWGEYHDPRSITPEMERLGKEFLKRFSINYERVYFDTFDDLIEQDMLVVGGHAWPKPVNGVYPRTERNINHAFLYFRDRYDIFDNYIEGEGDFIKRLAKDYALLGYGYRVFITEEPGQQLTNLMERAVTLLMEWRDLLLKQLGGLWK
ncbi:hypothetical protein C4568_03575 [Candidatus Parcubacteria bacterium]|nr:MAG: hypothetical protein C4568_03575 [Candidatus Parcubacteria bacterium]